MIPPHNPSRILNSLVYKFVLCEYIDSFHYTLSAQPQKPKILYLLCVRLEMGL